jgi:hypothetical protein
MDNPARIALRHHVTGAIERGEAEAITEVTRNRFDGLAFLAVKVRYAGPTDRTGGRWIASLYRDTDRTYRATVGYDDALPSGGTQAVIAAKRALAKALADNNPDASVSDYTPVPGDLSADEYVFVFVPTEYLS